MTDAGGSTVLTINSGSSSIKFSIYMMATEETLLCRGGLEGIGRSSGMMIVDGEGTLARRREVVLPAHAQALDELFRWLKESGLEGTIDAAGHRVVFGGEFHAMDEAVTVGLVADLKRLCPFAPNHLPHEILAIETVAEKLPGVRQIACFDTAFHRTLPEVARSYALPGELTSRGVRKYGFHGLSYEYIMEELERTSAAEAAGRVIIAHLGHGSSMAAVMGGRCVDTTMGLTPSGGLVMSTRTGDIDPGVIIYLLTELGMTAGEVNDAINKHGGLLGLSGASSDMKELLESEATDAGARLAVDVYCYQARKFVASLASTMGGVDTIVFTAGIGEMSPQVRGRIMKGLEFIGVELDPALNEAGAGVISTERSRCVVRVMETNEELLIARRARALTRGDGPNRP